MRTILILSSIFLFGCGEVKPIIPQNKQKYHLPNGNLVYCSSRDSHWVLRLYGCDSPVFKSDTIVCSHGVCWGDNGL
jgi:hypothetical protein